MNDIIYYIALQRTSYTSYIMTVKRSHSFTINVLLIYIYFIYLSENFNYFYTKTLFFQSPVTNNHFIFFIARNSVHIRIYTSRGIMIPQLTRIYTHTHAQT